VKTETKKPCKKGDTSSQQASNDKQTSHDTNGVAAAVKTETKKPCKKSGEQAQVKAEQKTVVIQPVVAAQPKVPCPTTAAEVKGSQSNGDSNHEFQGQETGNNGGGNDDNDENDNDDESGELAANCAPAAPAAAAVVAASTPAAPAAPGVSQSSATPAAQPAPVVTPAPAATPAPTAAAAGPAVASAPVSAPAPAAATPAAAGGVQGAVVALHPTKTKPSGGVLGATTRLGGTVASTRLPFTGLPLWIFAGVALALIGIGLAFRRVSAGRI
jgi:hypothetical protein